MVGPVVVNSKNAFLDAFTNNKCLFHFGTGARDLMLRSELDRANTQHSQGISAYTATTKKTRHVHYLAAILRIVFQTREDREGSSAMLTRQHNAPGQSQSTHLSSSQTMLYTNICGGVVCEDIPALPRLFTEPG